MSVAQTKQKAVEYTKNQSKQIFDEYEKTLKCSFVVWTFVRSELKKSDPESSQILLDMRHEQTSFEQGIMLDFALVKLYFASRNYKNQELECDEEKSSMIVKELLSEVKGKKRKKKQVTTTVFSRFAQLPEHERKEKIEAINNPAVKYGGEILNLLFGAFANKNKKQLFVLSLRFLTGR